MDRTSILQHDSFPGFQILKPRARFNTCRLQGVSVKRTGFVMLLNAKTVAFQRMRQRVRRYFSQAVIHNLTRGNFHNIQRIIGPGAAQTQCGFGKLSQPFWPVERQRLDIAGH